MKGSGKISKKMRNTLTGKKQANDLNRQFTKKKILLNLEKIRADYVILDLGAGSSYNVIDLPHWFYFLTPEILPPYAQLK